VAPEHLVAFLPRKPNRQGSGVQSREPDGCVVSVRIWAKGVLTMSTLLASDPVVMVPDWPGFRLFSRFPVFAGEGIQFESHPSGTVFRRSVGFLLFFGVHTMHTLASDLMFRVCGVPETAYSVVWGRG
jgi:hypothetical protein